MGVGSGVFYKWEEHGTRSSLPRVMKTTSRNKRIWVFTHIFWQQLNICVGTPKNAAGDHVKQAMVRKCANEDFIYMRVYIHMYVHIYIYIKLYIHVCIYFYVTHAHVYSFMHV